MSDRDPWAGIPAQPALKSLTLRAEVPASDLLLCMEAFEKEILFRVERIGWPDWTARTTEHMEVVLTSIGTRKHLMGEP